MQEQSVINTEEILNLASKIENNNNRINTTLKEVKQEVDRLSSSWSGEAANATKSSVDAFAAEYYDKYKEMIDTYVDYLRKMAAEGFVETEDSNTSVGSQFM